MKKKKRLSEGKRSKCHQIRPPELKKKIAHYLKVIIYEISLNSVEQCDHFGIQLPKHLATEQRGGGGQAES